MKSMSKDKKLLIIAFILGALLLVCCWYSPDSEFQSDSEDLVIGSMVYGARERGTMKYGLTVARETSISSGDYISTVMQEYYDVQEVSYTDYTSQIGLQGFAFRSVARLLCTGKPLVSSIFMLKHIMRAVCCIAIALITMGIVFCVGKKHNLKLAAAFYLTFLLSPWVADFSNNMYWVEFTWFVPMLLGLIISLDYKRYDKLWFYLLVFITIAVKSACGYEYITTVMLGMILFPLVDLFTKERGEKKTVFLVIIKMGLCALAGFFAIIVIHAIMRGDGNLAVGLNDIYVNDVLRRTNGANKNVPDYVRFPEYYNMPIKNRILKTLGMYFEFTTDVIDGAVSFLFVPLVVLSGVVMLWRAAKKENRWELILFVLAFVCTASWHVLANQHSSMHTHISFVLWYFGFVQMLVYAVICLIDTFLSAAQRVKDASDS